jgi:ADP-ribose pyrophosphatase YjhB (NUDIX family)/predicted RNA-binding Zn-ribbon protein involved in translation (DUF1610 family)
MIMKVDFALPRDGAVHRICLRCHADGVTRHKEESGIVYRCPACGTADGKSLYWGAGKEWIAKNGELWHDTAAVFVQDATGRILLYERTEFPFGYLTVPAGHIDKGEVAEVAARRELEEEVGIRGVDLTHAITLDLLETPCSAGAEAHRWHVYVVTVDRPLHIQVTEEEGRHPMWLTPEEARATMLLSPVRRVLDILDLSPSRLPIASLESINYAARA